MSNSRRVTVARLPLDKVSTITTGSHAIEVKLFFDAGGINYYDYANERKGFYLSATPVEYTRSDGGFLTTRFTAFSGLKAFIEPATRFNAKRLDTLAASIKDHPKYAELIAAVLVKSGDTLKASEAPAA